MFDSPNRPKREHLLHPDDSRAGHDLGEGVLAGRSTSDRQLGRVVYLAAAGNIAGSFRHWRSGSDIGDEGSLSYSAGLFDAFARLGVPATCLSPCATADEAEHGGIRAVNIPPMRQAGGFRFYLAWLFYSLALVARLWRLKPEVVLVSDRVVFFPLLALLRLRGTRIVHVLHIALTNALGPKGLMRRAVLRLEVATMRRCADAVFALPGPTADHLRKLLRGSSVPVLHFMPEWNLPPYLALSAPRSRLGSFKSAISGAWRTTKG